MTSNILTTSPYPKEKPSVVLFDMDGVLFDTMPFHTASWQSTAKCYGLETTRDEFYLYEGQKGTDTIKYLYKRQHGVEPSDEYVQEVYQYKTQLYRQYTDIKLIPHIRSFIEWLRDKGVKIGVVTGSSRSNALMRIDTYLSDLIDPGHIVTADDCALGKPHPEPYERGMKIFGSVPDETLVIENAPYGIEAAHKSRTFVIGVTTGPIPPETLYKSGADLVLPDMLSVMAWWEASFGHDKITL